VLNLLAVVKKLIKDEVWSVRDAACSASGYLYAAFVEECAPQYEDTLDLWFTHLSENTLTARHHTAQSIAKVFDKADIHREHLEARIT